jgi:hypothetical protein
MVTTGGAAGSLVGSLVINDGVEGSFVVGRPDGAEGFFIGVVDSG